MKHIFATVCIAGLVAGCSTNRPSAVGTTGGGSQTLTGSARSVAAVDETFARDASLSSVEKIELGKIGLRNSRNPEVRKLARSLVSEHSESMRELSRLLARKGIEPATALTYEFQATLEKLAALGGKEFDRAFKESVVKYHEASVELLEKHRSDGQDADLKRFAERSLPQLCEHLTAARALTMPATTQHTRFDDQNFTAQAEAH